MRQKTDRFEKPEPRTSSGAPPPSTANDVADKVVTTGGGAAGQRGTLWHPLMVPGVRQQYFVGQSLWLLKVTFAQQ